MANCVFCGNEGPVTREHVLPRWLGDLLPGDGHFTITRQGELGETRTYKDSSLGIVTRSVCAACNNGWMSELEGRAKPLLEPLISGHARTLTPTDQMALALWATKTSISLLYASKAPEGAEILHRAAVFDGRVPPNTGIWLAAYSADPPSYTSWIRTRTMEMRAENHQEDIHLGQFVTLTIGHYAHQVLLTPSAWAFRKLDALVPPGAQMFFRPVPQQSDVHWPPERALSSVDLARFADAFVSWISDDDSRIRILAADEE